LDRVREIKGRDGYGWLGTVDEADIGKSSTGLNLSTAGG
jgi:hypothetical protein